MPSSMTSPKIASSALDMESPVDVFACTRLLSSGLRVSTPPSIRPVSRRLQLVPDENNPPSPPCNVSNRCQSRTPLDDHDANSQDSGCAMSFSSDDSQGFKFAEPCGFAPKRLNSMESPRRNFQFYSFSSTSSDNSNSYDDCFFDNASVLPEADQEENTGLPEGMGILLNGRILSEYSPRKQLGDGNTPKRKVRAVSMRDEIKRPLSDFSKYETSPQKLRLKRLKSQKEDIPENKGTLFEYGFWKYAAPEPEKSELVDRRKSENELNIKMALQRSTQEDLIGNFSKPFALPLTPGKHQDLKSITCETLAHLINGKYEDTVASFKIIDCRYPYEYEGGHIKGAINLYTCDHISKELLQCKEKPRETSQTTKRDILVFHCEFSSERGPFLSRFLRKEDRAGNDYPNLHYPEMYLLHGGYSEFYRHYNEMCEPRSYRTMQDPAHQTEFKHFKAKSKSWAPGSHKKHTIRSLARLGF
ncbi:M-phase inducer phosphatase-like isoform X2 [Cimex lectularius]|uniref:protein-tyrosine-phosphatase n=1 Tax=Cimex lectularius TaxID=79782 RepID=A0A8I6SC44_CIMLE|nr:M-phase inducer phosphatase-like isoform X2 [Cimex lectularius]